MSARRHGREAGFTLIEIAVALSITILLSVIAVPGFSDVIANQQVKAGAVDLLAAITYARSEAIKRNREVELRAVDSDWAQGWFLRLDDPAHPGTWIVLREWAPGERIAVTGAAALAFRPDGRSAAGAVTLTVCDETGSGTVDRRRIRLDLSGYPNLTQHGRCDSGS